MKDNALKTTFKIFICFAFAVLDYYISIYAKLHFRPLFLDTIFEMTSAFAFGPVYGILCVLFKRLWNIILVPNLNRWPAYLYSFCTIFGVLIVCPFKKKFLDGEKDRLLLLIKLFLLSVIICLEMSITGGIIGRIVAAIQHTPYSMTVQTDSFMQLFANFIHSTLVLEIISRIPVNAIDRIITVFIPYVLALLITKTMNRK
ncbi:MAG: hypothetical protein KBT11_07080 [Treponema sp.]|nr:hypothetical protein [Candidatus Treponema equifaecale]